VSFLRWTSHVLGNDGVLEEAVSVLEVLQPLRVQRSLRRKKKKNKKLEQST
jgi:hypothetical protein